eukprot:ANDGO_07571.mRNA.1 hypothetical protein
MLDEKRVIVVKLRNAKQELDETSAYNLALPFGPISHVVVIPTPKRAILIAFDDADDAFQAIENLHLSEWSGAEVHVRYSTRSEVSHFLAE